MVSKRDSLQRLLEINASSLLTGDVLSTLWKQNKQDVSKPTDMQSTINKSKKFPFQGMSMVLTLINKPHEQVLHDVLADTRVEIFMGTSALVEVLLYGEKIQYDAYDGNNQPMTVERWATSMSGCCILQFRKRCPSCCSTSSESSLETVLSFGQVRS
jgi:hypothetical protein